MGLSLEQRRQKRNSSEERAKRNIYAKKWYAKNKSRRRCQCNTTRLKQLYGLTPADYILMLDAQNGLCAICHQPEYAKNQFGPRRLSVDHDHKTGKVRALLCNRCNNMVGFLETDTTLVTAAVSYICAHTMKVTEV